MPTCSFFDRRCPPRKRFGQIEFHSRAGRRDDRKNPTHAGFSLLALTMHSIEEEEGVFVMRKYEKIVVREPILSFKKLGLKAFIVKC